MNEKRIARKWTATYVPIHNTNGYGVVGNKFDSLDAGLLESERGWMHIERTYDGQWQVRIWKRYQNAEYSPLFPTIFAALDWAELH